MQSRTESKDSGHFIMSCADIKVKLNENCTNSNCLEATFAKISSFVFKHLINGQKSFIYDHHFLIQFLIAGAKNAWCLNSIIKNNGDLKNQLDDHQQWHYLKVVVFFYLKVKIICEYIGRAEKHLLFDFPLWILAKWLDHYQHITLFWNQNFFPKTFLVFFKLGWVNLISIRLGEFKNFSIKKVFEIQFFDKN